MLSICAHSAADAPNSMAALIISAQAYPSLGSDSAAGPRRTFRAQDLTPAERLELTPQLTHHLIVHQVRTRPTRMDISSNHSTPTLLTPHTSSFCTTPMLTRPNAPSDSSVPSASLPLYMMVTPCCCLPVRWVQSLSVLEVEDLVELLRSSGLVAIHKVSCSLAMRLSVLLSRYVSAAALSHCVSQCCSLALCLSVLLSHIVSLSVLLSCSVSLSAALSHCVSLSAALLLCLSQCCSLALCASLKHTS